jgi:hypothetical protein
MSMADHPSATAGGEERVNEEDFSAVSGTPFVEEYAWGLIGFQFYEGWMDDVRSCAAGLRDRLAKEDRKCNPAERLQKALISWHYADHPVQPVTPSPRRSRWSRFFDLLSTGGYSELTRDADK